MNREITFAKPGDEAQLISLYRQCFPDGEAFWRWLLSKEPYRPENTLTLRENGKMVSSLQMMPVTLRLHGESYASHYIYAAATLPEWQGRGLMGQLLEYAAREGLRRKQRFSVLIVEEPGLLDYYARFGYRPQIMWQYLSASVLSSPLLPGENLRKIRQKDIPALQALYEAAAEKLLHGARDNAHWESQLELYGDGAFLLENTEGVKAYCFADENGITEAVGESAVRLAAQIAPGKVFRTVPENGEILPGGSIRPLTEAADALLGQQMVYLNLMYN